MNTTNKNSFNKNLSILKASGKTIRLTVQNLVIQAIAFYAENINKNGDKVNGDTVYLSRLMEEAQGCKSIRTGTLQAFIEAHANVKYVSKKGKDKKTIKVFVKQGKEIDVKPIESQWYDWDKGGLAKTTYTDIIGRLKAVAKDFNDGVKKPKKGTEIESQEVIKVLSEALAKIA